MYKLLISLLLVTSYQDISVLVTSAKYTLCTTAEYSSACQGFNKSTDIQCIVLKDEASCVEHVNQNRAHFNSVSPEAAFAAVHKSMLVTLARFKIDTEADENAYKIIMYSNTDISKGLNSLRNFSYCHPGFDSTDVNPLVLIDFERQILMASETDTCTETKIPLMERHLKRLHDYFGPSCRPGRWTTNIELDIKLTYSDNLTINQSRQCGIEVKWCTTSRDEQQKCEAWSIASLYSAIQPVLNCVQKSNKGECLEAIKTGEADVVTIDADLGYSAKLNGLEMIAFLETAEQSVIRTALVVKPNITTLEGLKNKRGCFAGYCDAACMSFIKVIRGILLNNKTSPQLLNDVLGSSSAPGAGSLNKKNLCSLCVSNTTQDPCSADATNKYYGNEGALICLKEAGEFAVITKTDGLILPENARVLCKNGSLAGGSLEVDDDCFLSVVIAEAIVARQGDLKNLDIQLMLKESERRFVQDQHAPFKLFSAFNSIPDMLFKDSTIGLELNNSKNYLVKNYQSLFLHIESDKDGSFTLKTPSFLVFTLMFIVFYM